MRLIRYFCLAIMLFLPCTLVLGSEPHTPQPGDPERKAILDALRVPVEHELHKKVVFKVDWLKVMYGWAFMYGVPLQPDGEFLYQGTVYEEYIEDEHFDDWICALLRFQGKQWRVIVYQIGATDVAWIGWHEIYKAPPEIFPDFGIGE